MGGPDSRRDPSPRVPPQSDDFQETTQIIPPERVRRIEADPAHGGRRIVDPAHPDKADPIPAERDAPQATRDSEPPTTVAGRRPASGRHETIAGTGGRNAGPGHAADDRMMLKDPESMGDHRHRPQASDLYRLDSGHSRPATADAVRRHRPVHASVPSRLSSPGFFVAGAVLGVAAALSFHLWITARR